MILSTQQLQAVENGESVALNLAGTECILVRRDADSRMIGELNLLANEADEIISQGEADKHLA